MRFQRIIQAVHFQPWLITPRAHASIRELLRAKLEPRSEDILDAMIKNRRMMTVQDGIAQIPVAGVIGKGLSKIEKACGACGVEEIESDIADAMGNDMVQGIFLDVTSPGGTVSGVPELGEIIGEAAKRKPVMAWTDEEMASGAYWLAAGATAIYATPSSEVGSIGVYLPWIDQTAAYAAEGLKVDLIRNTEGTFKGAGFPGTALTEDQRAQFQTQVDEIFDMFAGHVTQYRKVKRDAMRGQTFLGASAVSAGLVDSIATRDMAMADLRRLMS